MANLLNPANVVDAYRGGVLFGQQQREQKRLESEREQLRGLAPGIMQGDPAAFSQAATINPEAATTYQSAGDQQYRRLMNVSKMMRQAIDTGNPQAKARAFQTIRPFLAQMAEGRPVPEQWDDSLLQGFEQFENRIAMAKEGSGQSGVQSTYVDDKGQRIAVMRDGTLKPLGGADTGMSRQTITVTGPDGAPQQFTFDKRTGGYMPAQLGGVSDMGGQQVQQMTAADGQPIRVGTDLDPALIQQIQQNPQAFQAVPDQGMAQLPNVQRGPSPFVGQTPAQKAAQEAAARAQVELQYAPAMEQVRTQGAVTRAQQEAQVKQGAERSAAQYEKDAALRLYEAGMQGLSSGLEGSTTGPIAGRLPAMTSAQQIAEGGVAAMAPILKSMFRTAGEGTFTDKDQDLLMAMIPTRTDTDAAREAKLANIDNIVRAKLGQGAPRGTGGQAPIRIQNAQDYQAVPSGATYIAPDGTTRRKP